MKILFLADVHFDISRELHYPDTGYVLPKFWDWLYSVKKNYDLLVISGDMTVRGAAKIEELKQFKEKLDSVGLRYIVTPGNHDLAPHKVRASTYPGLEDYEEVKLEETNFAKTFGIEGIRYSEIIDNMHYITLALRDEDPDNQINWLEKTLKSNSYPKLVFCHYPLLQTREEGACKGWGYSRIGALREKLTSLIFIQKEHNVIGYFCGHQHINSKVKLGNTYQIETGATGLSTVCYKDIDIGKGIIKVNTYNIPGFNKYYGSQEKYTNWFDDFHSTITSYFWGNKDERDFILEY